MILYLSHKKSKIKITSIFEDDVIMHVMSSKDGSTVRSEFAYYVPRTLNRTIPAYRTSVQFLERTVPTYPARINTKKAYRTSVPYFLAKIEAYRTILTYRTVLPSLLLTTHNFSWLWNHLSLNQRSQFTHLTSASAVFCLCIQKAGAMCEKSGIF